MINGGSVKGMKFVFSVALLFFVSLAAAGCSTVSRMDERSQSVGCVIPVRGQRCVIVNVDLNAVNRRV